MSEETCTWTRNQQGVYVTECGKYWAFLNGRTPKENGWKFCIFCGKKLANPTPSSADSD